MFKKHKRAGPEVFKRPADVWVSPDLQIFVNMLCSSVVTMVTITMQIFWLGSCLISLYNIFFLNWDLEVEIFFQNNSSRLVSKKDLYIFIIYLLFIIYLYIFIIYLLSISFRLQISFVNCDTPAEFYWPRTLNNRSKSYRTWVSCHFNEADAVR